MVRKNRQNKSSSNPEGRRNNSLKEILPKNKNQKDYMLSIENNTVTFGIGPAGSGKTFLAVYEALCHRRSKKQTGIKRIIVSRPAIEAGGERLGFLPGDLGDKMDPYLRPIFDALVDVTGNVEEVRRELDKGVIEVVPLAYMRGRTFNDAFIILDEAQNATLDQLKMILTRIGENCKLVVDGDPSQSDIQGRAGLINVTKILQDVEDLAIVEFGPKDIVRSKIVTAVVAAFEKYDKDKG